jgi:hypothetical protein
MLGGLEHLRAEYVTGVKVHPHIYREIKIDTSVVYMCAQVSISFKQVNAYLMQICKNVSTYTHVLSNMGVLFFCGEDVYCNWNDQFVNLFSCCFCRMGEIYQTNSTD